jgi:hypothetical protein
VKMVAKLPIYLVGLDHRLQWDEATNASGLETEQRRLFINRVRELLDEFRPNLIADESGYTSYAPFRALYADIPTTCVEIPQAIRNDPERRLVVARAKKGDTLCPFVDSRRECFWRWRIFQASKNKPDARIMMWLGAAHLHAIPEKPLSFPKLLSDAGYSVTVSDLREESWWDGSWLPGWRDPNPPHPGFQVGFPCCLADGTFDFAAKGCRQTFPDPPPDPLDDPFGGVLS